MNGTLYPKLALTNIRKNARTYIPYIITCVLTIAMYYIMKSLSMNDGLSDVQGGEAVQEMLKFGNYVIAIFACIFLFYTNSFLTKNRKKEFGLFNILGMEKRHLAKVIGYESFFVTLISLAGGLVTGIILDKLMYLVLLKILNAKISLGFYISKDVILNTLILFGILFFLIFLNSLRMIHLSKPIELLRGGNTGEKEPKAKWIIALLGIIALGAGYYIAITVKNPISALLLFFVAVILVILGTYLLFTAGSIALLKILKANKRYYYKTNHFISVSGMMYRMKQNAVGLANICILSTMVLTTVSPTVSMIIGVEDIIMQRYPYQLSFSAYKADKEKYQGIVDIVNETADEEGIKITKEIVYSSLEFSALYEGNDEFRLSNDTNDMRMLDYVYNLNFITAEDYSNYINKEVTLNDDEVIFWSNRTEYKNDSFRLFDKTYNIVEHTNNYIEDGMMSVDICPTFGIVVKDMSIIENLMQKQAEVYGGNSSTVVSQCKINTNGNSEEQIRLYEKIYDKLAVYVQDNSISYYTECREAQRDSAYGLYGGLFFLGMFLSVLFTIAAVLIIYYKQISEGYDDKKRFEIMQKVGMTEQEVKKSIHSQVLTVFFLPLITAGIHTAFAFPLVKKILAMLQLTNTNLYILCTVTSFAIFAVVYGIIYSLTAKIYYKNVQNNRN
ncbi:MAG: ABC transporter permease [Ruminococcus sp.]|nr:ABC transporter permease [Ruminococcus sp.]